MPDFFASMPKYLVFFLYSCLLLSCRPKRQPEASFYYWKSTFHVSGLEKTHLKQLKINRLYIRFFDIDWNYETHQALPVAPIQFTDSIPVGMQVIPVVFITNRTIVQIPAEQLPSLAEKMTQKLLATCQIQHLNLSEIQLDCDWSEKSQEKFFRLARLIKAKLAGRKVQLSATIRLHQLKSGVPPVDRGVLMFYNMGQLDGSDTDNSILDLNIARPYLHRLKAYPIPLDVALPIYQWLVVKREDRVVNLLTHVSVDSLTHTSRYEPLTEKKFRVKESHYLHSVYLYRGDELRLETIALPQLQQAAELLQPIVNHPNPHILFYYLDEKNISRYAPQDLENLVSRFR